MLLWSSISLSDLPFASWAVLYLEIASSAALALPSALRDEDILTPFPTTDPSTTPDSPRGVSPGQVLLFWHSS